MILKLLLRQLKFRLKQDVGAFFSIIIELTCTLLYLAYENIVLKVQRPRGKTAHCQEKESEDILLA